MITGRESVEQEKIFREEQRERQRARLEAIAKQMHAEGGTIPEIATRACSTRHVVRGVLLKLGLEPNRRTRLVTRGYGALKRRIQESARG